MLGCLLLWSNSHRLPRRRLLSYGVILIDSQGGASFFSSRHNLYEQLGRSSGDLSEYQRIVNIPPMLAASCGSAHTLSLDENGYVWSWGLADCGQLGMNDLHTHPDPTLVPSLKGISALVAGRDHSLAFPQEGGLLVFGSNRVGQLGVNRWAQLLQFVRGSRTAPTPTLCPFQPALPYSFTFSSRKKSARSAPL